MDNQTIIIISILSIFLLVYIVIAPYCCQNEKRAMQLKETLLSEKDELLLHMETLKHSNQNATIIDAMREVLNERIRLIDSQIFELNKQLNHERD